MATWGHGGRGIGQDYEGPVSGGSSKLLQEQDVAYEYLCRLEETKKWLEGVLTCELPPVMELEDTLQNGVVLCRLGMKLLPNDPMWQKVYDIDLTKFKTKGLDYRYTDNINFWLTSLQKLGLPKVFYPVMTDVYHKKNIPKLIYCLHALGHLLLKKGILPNAMDDLYGVVQFSSELVNETSQTIKSQRRIMPAFGLVQNLVEEELQYQAMGLCDSYEEDVPPSPDDVVLTLADKRRDLFFDDPKYISSVQAKKAVENGSHEEAEDGTPFAVVPCESSGPGVEASLYLRQNFRKRSTDNLGPLDKCLVTLSATLDESEPNKTLKLLQSPAANLPFVYRDKDAYLYHDALLKEKAEGLPQILLPVYSGVDRDMCEQVLEKMSPGAFIVRHSQTVEGAYVFSFKNQTGIKHWKLSMKDGKFYRGTGSVYATLESFVENFVQALSDVTKLYVYCGMASVLQPTFKSTEAEAMINSLREADDTLSYGQVCHVIKEVNTTIRRGRKSVTEPSHRGSNSVGEVWNESMVVKMSRPDAETTLDTKGKPGSFIMRSSDRGDYALTFRTKNDTRHWKIVKKAAKYYVQPRPNPYGSLLEIIKHFREAVSQETGLNMMPHIPTTTPTDNNDIPQSANETNSHLSLPALHLKVPPLPPSPLRRPLSVISPLPTPSLNKLNPANITSWSVDDVCQWLTQEGLGKFVDIFRDNAVDGDCLLTLDNNLLKDDLGVTALGHRSRIMKRVLVLKEQVHPHLS